MLPFNNNNLARFHVHARYRPVLFAVKSFAKYYLKGACVGINYKNLAVVIPSLDPTEALSPYIKNLLTRGFDHIYVVNDGSDTSYDTLFSQISDMESCVVLTHTQNLGKGCALKTAYRHILQNFSECEGIITVDSDGQHTVKDVCQIADALVHYPKSLILGERNLTGKDVPVKSKIGNHLSALLFFLFHGIWIQDTQTGLRGFDISLVQEMISIPGDRFEYEMSVLVTCASKKIPVNTLTIDTIYLEGNVNTHFDPVKDSLKIGRVLVAKACRFMASSGISSAVDILLCWTFLYLFTSLIPEDIIRIGLSVVLARCISMLVNYTINRAYVFKTTPHPHHSFWRYLALALANMFALTALIYLGSSVLPLDERLASLLSSTLLFFINYQVQRIWVFSVMQPGDTK